jgi:hypothetical protein
MSYGAAAADDYVYNNDNKLFEKEHRKVIRKYGTTNMILH